MVDPLAAVLCGHAESVGQDRCGFAGRGDNEFPQCRRYPLVPSRRRLGQSRPKLSTGQHFPIRGKSAEQAFY